MLDLACHLAAGLPWPPRDEATERAPEPWPVARPLRIALFENEGPVELFRDKAKRKLAVFPHDIDELGGYLGVQVWRWGAFSFADDDAFTKAAVELEELRVDLVIGDPLNMLGVEGVGSPEDTRRFVHRLRMLGLGTTRAFLLLHHFRERVESTKDELRKLSGAWGGHLDSLITLAQGAADNELRLAFPKLRVGARRAAAAGPARQGVPARRVRGARPRGRRQDPRASRRRGARGDARRRRRLQRQGVDDRHGARREDSAAPEARSRRRSRARRTCSPDARANARASSAPARTRSCGA